MRPKKLYRYNLHHELEVHVVGTDCNPQMVNRSSEGTLWRCLRHGVHDRYGFDDRRGAEDEEIKNAKRDIYQLHQWIDILIGTKPGSKKKIQY